MAASPIHSLIDSSSAYDAAWNACRCSGDRLIDRLVDRILLALAICLAILFCCVAYGRSGGSSSAMSSGSDAMPAIVIHRDSDICCLVAAVWNACHQAAGCLILIDCVRLLFMDCCADSASFPASIGCGSLRPAIRFPMAAAGIRLACWLAWPVDIRPL